MLRREGQSGPGCQSGAPVQAWTLRARPDLPPVRPGLGKTHSVCVPLRCGQPCVLVSENPDFTVNVVIYPSTCSKSLFSRLFFGGDENRWCLHIMRCFTCQFKQPQMVLTLFILVSPLILLTFSALKWLQLMTGKRHICES